MCVCVCGMNLICITLAYPHISSFCTCILKPTAEPFEDSEPMGLKVDIAEGDCTAQLLGFGG